LVEHYRQRELNPDTVWKTHSTKVTYKGYLNKWIMPRWRNCEVSADVRKLGYGLCGGSEAVALRHPVMPVGDGLGG